jgi:hypothetical protein
MDVTVPTAEALDAAVRRIRRIARPEAPYGATRCVIDEDETVLLVDTSTLTGWVGWRCAGAQHLLSPLDIVRHAQGHEVVLPDMREPVARACGRREAAEAGWHRGEAVTLLVSLLRGVAEAASAGVIEGAGEWWIAADGRPMFAFDTGGGEPIVVASRVLIDRIADRIDDRVLARAIDDVRAALDRPEALAHRLDDLEEPLFDAAAPQPIRSEAQSGDATPRAGRTIVSDDGAAEGRLSWLRDAVDRHIDASLGEALSEAIVSVGRRIAARRTRFVDRSRRERRPRTARGKGARWPLVVVGSATVAVVVGGGMLWPSDAPNARAREQTALEEPRGGAIARAGSTESTGGEESSASSPTPAPAGPADPVDAAAEILDDWTACGDACGAPDGVERSGAAADAARTLSLVDDYGAVALIEVAAPEQKRQLLVIERSDDRWRVRDLYAAPE